MTVYRAPVEEIGFLLNHVLGIGEISRLPGYEEATPDMVEAILGEAARFFGEVVAPTNQLADAQGTRVEDRAVVPAPALDGLYRQITEAGWCVLSDDPRYGGQGLPNLLAVPVREMIQSANLAFSLCMVLNEGVVTALGRYGSQQQKELYLPKLISGEWAGTMCLTEAQAGSDLALIRTRAVPAGDHYLLSGEKIFITWGDQPYSENIVHLVLARTPDAPEGVRGISLFVVPKYRVDADGSCGERNDVYPLSVEHKLGIHASPTCVLSFGAGEGAVGYLVGEENEGLKYMFAMMNHARLGVGLQGISVAVRAYQQAAAYARERVQGAVPGEHKATIIKHPDVRRMLMQMRALTEGGRALAYSAMAHEDHAAKSEDPERAAYHHRRVDLLTPLVKGWCTEIGVEVASLGIQVHGGMGFIEETGAAQHLRDARILPIYEGTNGIQALDLVGRKFLYGGGAAVREYLAEVEALVAALRAEKDGQLEAIAEALDSSLKSCKEVGEYIAANAQDWTVPGALAFNFMMMLATLAAGALMARAAMAATKLNAGGEGNRRFNENKVITATFYAEHILPRNMAYAETCLAGSASTMALPEEDF
jgi:alkylation response protein AidB-like acyl-CoA dehydrogenase